MVMKTEKDRDEEGNYEENGNVQGGDYTKNQYEKPPCPHAERDGYGLASLQLPFPQFVEDPSPQRSPQ
jgi:hypothetical protein